MDEWVLIAAFCATFMVIMMLMLTKSMPMMKYPMWRTFYVCMRTMKTNDKTRNSMTYWDIPGRGSIATAVAPSGTDGFRFRFADMTAVPKTETGVPLPMSPKQESPVMLSSNEALEFEEDADESWL
jgi:hypothetical protein